MIRVIKTVYIWVVVLGLASAKLHAQDIQNIGVPYVENFPKNIYQSGNQNWSITQDEHGVFYFGNSEGLLSYDGRFWENHQIPHHLIVRSVAADNKGHIFTGGYGEMGYWEYDEKAILKYHSLTNLVKDKSKLNNEIWKIYVDNNQIIFQTFANIFIYNNQTNTIKVIEGNGSFIFMFKVGKRYLIGTANNKIYELINDKLNLLKGSEGISGVLSILPYGDNSFLVGTAKNGLFLYNGERFTKWESEANDFLKTYQLNNGVKIFNKYFAFGTILNGVIILDQNGKIVQHINKSGGLQNNTVLSLFVDNSQNLWVGLDNGIDRVELNSPLYFYFDKNGAFGTVYSSIIFNDKIYLGTNQGLYYSNWNSDPAKRQSFNFKFIPGSQGQVWDLSVYDGNLFCGHNNGTYLVKDNTIEKISSISGGWTLKKMNSSPDKLIQGTYTGLVIYQNIKGKYIFSHQIDGFNQPCRYVEQDNRGNIWVSHPYKGIFKINLSSDLRTVKSTKVYDENYGIPTTYGINIFNLDGRIVFSSDSGFYVYDEISDRFAKYNELNDKIGSFSSSNKLIKADDKKFWFVDHGKVALANFSNAGKISIDSSLFNVINGRMVKNYENISKINDNLFLISVDDGFVIFSKKVFPDRSVALPKVFIGKIENITSDNYLITESGLISKQVSIPYSQNSIRINYSLPYYRQGEIKYQYLLDGYSNSWSSWSASSQKDFTNLPYGKYNFKVRAIVNNVTISSISQFEFEIIPPFYATIWAWMFYLIIFSVLVYFFRIFYFKKLEKHQRNIQKHLQEEQDELLRQENIINEQKLIKLKNEKLQAELESKGREVTNSAMNIVYKNELLQKIKDEIANLKDKEGKKLAEEQLRKVEKIIDESMSNEQDWNLFETSFNETHENFFKKLKHDYPDLVPNDLKLCAYLRLNMSSKEMASLLNISLRGMEIRRYRLRKKLSLPHDKNLVEFLIEL
ncbi:transcriptional regulator [Pedobacter psychrophilus]|uniref:Transcriptional regulator n=2 Tax=Pedobacter psychrophilus TaxID=1826909 RepID=A0A179DFU1_9SPHI|nr:transcriptional regulator [Pedobacter psychrophilus]